MNKIVVILLLVLVVGVIISYVVTIYELYNNESWIFAPYQPKLLPNSCQPLISTRKLTPDEQEARVNALTSS